MLTESGRDDIAEDVEKTNTAVVDGVDYVADEIAVLGDDLPEELREQLGETGEILYDSLIRSDVSEEERIALLEEDLVQYLASEEVLKNAPEEEVRVALDNLKDRADKASQLDNGNQTTETFVEPEALASSDMPESNVLDTLEVTGSYPGEPDILQKATDGLGRAAQVVDKLSEENPQTASALSTALGLVTGGVVREGISIAVGAATEIAASQSETVRDALGQADAIKDQVTNIAANIIYDSGSVEDFVSDVNYEVTNPDDRPTELGASATGVKGGVATGVTLASIFVGAGGSKKGSTDNKGSGSNETSGVGSGPENNATRNANNNFDDQALDGQVRQQQMLDDNQGYNISSARDEQRYGDSTIGGSGTFVTDRNAFENTVGTLPENGGTVRITRDQLSSLEENLGLRPGSLESGSVIRQVDNIRDASPQSPYGNPGGPPGNEYFRGSGMHLPDGSPEVIINPQTRQNNPNIGSSWTLEVVD